MSEFKKLIQNQNPVVKIDEPHLTQLNLAAWKRRAKTEQVQRLKLELQVAAQELSMAEQNLTDVCANINSILGIGLGVTHDWNMDTGELIEQPVSTR